MATMLAAGSSSVHAESSSRIYIPGPGLNSAWLLGHALGLHTEISEPPASFTEEEAEAFRHGWLFGADNRGPEESPDWIGDYLAELHGDDHDAQPDPNCIEVATISENEWRDISEGFVSYPDEEVVAVFGHRAAEIGGAR